MSDDLTTLPPRPAGRIRTVCWTAATTAAVLVGLLLSGVVGTATVVSASMTPTYDVGDTVLTSRLGAGDPGRGDVVVVEVPLAWADAAEASGADLSADLMVKRVAGVGGDHVVCCAPGGRLVVNDEVLDEAYLAVAPEVAGSATYDVVVPEGHLWLLGDNRPGSFDSRAMRVRERDAAFVPVSAVRSRVLLGF